MEVPVGFGSIHLLPEGDHLTAGHHRIGIAVADEDASSDLPWLRRQPGIEQAVKAHHSLERSAVSRQLERSLSAHAEADRGKRQSLRFRQSYECFERCLEAPAIYKRVRPYLGGKLSGLVETSWHPAVEVRDQREIALFGQRSRLVLHRRRRIHDRREDQHRRTRRSMR